MATLKNTTISDTGFLQVPVGTTAQRPGTPVAGQVRFNASTGVVENYIDTASTWLPAATKNVKATGGNVVYDTNINGTEYRVHLFTSTGTSTFTVQHPGKVEYLIIAGGGAGSKAHNTNTCGGGGAGGVITGTTNVTTQAYSIVVGAGGTCNTAGGNRTGTNGSNSSAFGLTAIGGGRGGDQEGTAASGGSGGGAGSYRVSIGATAPGAAGSGTAGQGNNGGAHSGTVGNGGCGGGGAGSVGQADGVDPTNVGNGTNGGFGISSSITGYKVMYAAGGGSSPWQDATPGKGGIGGGGNGGGNSANAVGGLENTGSGGGGAKSGTIAGNGGSGIVVIRYPLQSTADTTVPKVTDAGLVLDVDFSKPTVYTGDGVVVNDSRLTDVNGIAVGSPTFINGRTHRASMDFNGSTQHIGLGRSFCIEQELGSGNVSYALEAWFRVFSLPPGSTLSGYPIIGNASSTGVGMQLTNISSSTRVNFGCRNTSNFDSNTSLSLNTWYHVVCVRQVGVVNKIYINGQQDSATLGSSSLEIQSGAGEMQIAYSNTRFTNRLDGEIALCRLYNTWLSADEVSNNFEATRWRFGV
jgi:hypothetical protein